MDSKKSTGRVTQRPSPTESADRFNSGKLRYDLIPPRILMILAQIYTNGAVKYDPDNWKTGLSFRGVIDSAMRHLEKFRACEDIDKDSGLHTLGHAAWNCLTLMEYGYTHPEYDDRDHWWLNPKRIGFDIDGVLAGFHEQFKIALRLEGYVRASEQFATHWRSSSVGFSETWDKYCKDPQWWIDLPSIHGRATDFPFQPVVYITHRTFPHAQGTTEKWLDKWNYPAAPVIATGESKIAAIEKRKLDIFVDDKFENFQEINTHTTCVCYLWDAPHNRKFPVGDLRIHSLEELIPIVYSNG